MRLPILTSAPATEPVSLVEAKAHLRVEVSDEDTQISSLIAAARGWAEEITGRKFITQTWTYSFSDWTDLGGYGLILPFFPIQSVSIAYSDVNNATQTLAASNYMTDFSREYGLVRLKSTGIEPVLYVDSLSPITVSIVCGYGNAATNIPSGLRESVKAAILLRLGSLFANREEIITGVSVNSPALIAAKNILGPYRLAKSMIGHGCLGSNY